jgi:hypothetical protein
VLRENVRLTRKVLLAGPVNRYPQDMPTSRGMSMEPTLLFCVLYRQCF